jgi:hypothetical protein
VDLCELPDKYTAIFRELPLLEQSFYAIVEIAFFDKDETEVGLSEIFVPITKDICGFTNNAVSHMKFYLADVEAIVKAIAVMPDIGGTPNAYFIVKDQETWRIDFMEFLERPLDLAKEISSDEETDR